MEMNGKCKIVYVVINLFNRKYKGKYPFFKK